VVTLSRFNFTQYLQLLQEYQVTRSYVVPSIIHSLANDPAVEAYDLSHLRYLISGAAPLRKQTRQRCAERLGCIIKQGYGLTETSPSTHVDYDEPERIRPDSVGPPVRSTECQIIGLLSGQPLAAGEVGEVLVRGPQVMRGYLNDARDPTGG
jgi:acyl-CoA synthetase (AMP-forming)/AMP-acid ligase II